MAVLLANVNVVVDFDGDVDVGLFSCAAISIVVSAAGTIKGQLFIVTFFYIYYSFFKSFTDKIG